MHQTGQFPAAPAKKDSIPGGKKAKPGVAIMRAKLKYRQGNPRSSKQKQHREGIKELGEMERQGGGGEGKKAERRLIGGLIYYWTVKGGSAETSGIVRRSCLK